LNHNIQQNIVYFIGAGFSAPFGIPVMSNFIDKAHDLYFSDKEKYKELGSTLELINNYANIKNTMNVNLFNIEDLLSLMVMVTYTNPTKVKKNKNSLLQISEFIKTVINEYTPNTFSVTNQMTFISSFITQIANFNIKENKNQSVKHEGRNYHEIYYDGKLQQNTNFSLISLNYDMLIENGLSHLHEKHNEHNKIAGYPGGGWSNNCFRSVKETQDDGIPFAKLHGSVDSEIVPPTWDKTSNKGILKDWILARQLLENATHIIFLGYSLPHTDSYIKYLLASSLKNNHRLKRISAITLDGDNSTEIRYKNLFGYFRSFYFHNSDILNFFEFIREYYFKSGKSEGYNFDQFDSDFSSMIK